MDQFTSEETEPITEEVKEKTPIDTNELASDLVGAGFKMWKLFNPKVRELDNEELKNISQPFAKIIDKYELTQYLKYFAYTDEILFVYNLGNAVIVRTKELKGPQTKPVDDKTAFKEEFGE